MKLKIKSALRIWFPVAFVATILSVLIYLSIQQSFRLSANDPQIQIAEDNAQLLLNGKSVQEVIGQLQVDISKSLSPFIIIFDDSTKPVASQAVLEGRIPTPPTGVFTYTKQHKQDRITWEPKPGVRIAAILVHFEGANPGFILVGRSLRETENRESRLGLQVLLISSLALVGSLAVGVISTIK